LELDKYLIDATLEVFASMIFIDITPEAVNNEPVSAFDPNISSLIGLAGDMKGILGIHCPAEVALAITSSMLGMEVTDLGEDAKDAIGEIANMVAGGLKVALSGDAKKIELAIPTTVIGQSIRTSGLSGASRLMLPFTCDKGRFGLELRYVME
jgi:chemotaxis protein CheX